MNQRFSFNPDHPRMGRRRFVQIGAKAQADDLWAATDMALSRADRQLRKHLDKVKNHNTASLGENEVAVEDVLTSDLEEAAS